MVCSYWINRFTAIVKCRMNFWGSFSTVWEIKYKGEILSCEVCPVSISAGFVGAILK